MAKNICGIMIGEALSAEEAKRHIEITKNCPYLVVSGTTSNKIYSVYIVPEDKKWWLRYPESHPKAMDSEKAWVYIIENMSYPKKLSLKLPKKKTEIAPCGANCQVCPLQEEYNCNGCPATTNYEKKRQVQKR